MYSPYYNYAPQKKRGIEELYKTEEKPKSDPRERRKIRPAAKTDPGKTEKPKKRRRRAQAAAKET